MKFAYADPPYIGKARMHYAGEAAAAGRFAEEVDHPALVGRLTADYPEGWALSCNSTSLPILLPLCPSRTRVLAWVKPFAVPKKNVYPMYAWEPVLFHGGRRMDATCAVPDWHMASRSNMRPDVTLTAKGAKPLTFCLWLLRCFGFMEGDLMDDLFPGTGTMNDAVSVFLGQMEMPA